MIEHTLFALAICAIALAILFSSKAKLHEPDEHSENPGSEAGRKD